MQRVVYYQGDQIYFSPIEMTDEPLLRKWINDPRVWSTVSFRPPINAQRETEWIENLGKSDTEFHFGIVVRDGDRLIGTCSLHTRGVHKHSASLGIAIGDIDSQNQGYGKEAMRLLVKFGFEEMNLNRIELCVFEHNARAIRVYESVGFLQEGRHRQASYRNGQYRDIYRYAILRQEYDAAKSAERESVGDNANAEMSDDNLAAGR